MSERISQIRHILERLYTRYNRREFIGSDPLQFVYRYSNRDDMEVAAFLASGLAYGRVEQIEKSLNDLLGRMGESPYAFVRDFNATGRQKLRTFKHRFTSGDDISDLLELLRGVFGKFGSIEKLFVKGYVPGDRNIIAALSKFCDSLLDAHAKTYNGRVPKGLGYLLPRPAGGSACKRLNLFLRWMVRKDDVDLGLWKSIDKSRLIVPVDVHMGRLSRTLGLHDRKTVSLSGAVRITEAFAEIEPADPVKYDFALSRLGIIEDCNGSYGRKCRMCELLKICFRR